MGVGSLPSMTEDISYLTQREAAEIDEILMGPLGFSVDQLMVSLFFGFLSNFLSWVRLIVNYFRILIMGSHKVSFLLTLQELAGLSVATSIAEVMLFCFLLSVY